MGGWNGIGSESAHMASLSDCFSKATVSTRSWMPACDELAGDDRGRAADAARGVHPEQRLAGRAERVGQVQLGHHHALEEVGRLADDDRVDVGPVELGVVRGRGRGLPDEPGHRHVAPGRLVLGLADADDGDRVWAYWLAFARVPPASWRSRRRRWSCVPLPAGLRPFGSVIAPPDAHEVLLQARAAGGVGDASAARRRR